MKPGEKIVQVWVEEKEVQKDGFISPFINKGFRLGLSNEGRIFKWQWGSGNDLQGWVLIEDEINKK